MRLDLAAFFDRQREIIEAAETPFAKLAIFILPILAPIVPASLTGLHLYKLFLLIFVFSYADRISATLAILVALVLEMLGYVGAISFIQAIFRWVKTKNSLYALPALLNGLAYLFYLVLMFLVNYMLGQYFQTANIINIIVGLLSFVTVPTGLLAANYLSQKELKEEDREDRKLRKDERIQKYAIKHGAKLSESSVTYQKVTESSQNLSESPTKVSETFPKDWRKLRPNLSAEDVQKLANLSAEGVKKLSVKHNVDERTVINWRMYAQRELGIRQ